MKIAFLLPCIMRHPAGGFKVVYEYANRLVADGYDVTIVYPAVIKTPGKHPYRRYLKGRLFGRYKCGWFALDARVKEKFVLRLDRKHVPEADIYFATAVQTSSYLNGYDIPAVRKFYLIQGFEAWGITPEQVIETYRYPMRKIVISKWLLEIMEDNGEKAEYIPNGFDFNFFHKSVEYKARKPYRIAMLWHNNEGKGCKYGLEALEMVKTACPQAEAVLFGTPNRPGSLPGWCEYYRMPDKETFNRIYNEAAVFLAPSNCEGFGLPVGEAMMCGAAVVCTDNGGYREMVIPDETAIVVPVGDSRAMADGILRLINDPELRVRYASAGYQHIQQYTWDNAYDKLKLLFDDATEIRP